MRCGASASWGSDAVSGVVNFIFDKKFEGFKLNLNGGISNYADDPKAQIQFAAGTSFLGGRAHFEISGEFTSEAGINTIRTYNVIENDKVLALLNKYGIFVIVPVLSGWDVKMDEVLVGGRHGWS